MVLLTCHPPRAKSIALLASPLYFLPFAERQFVDRAENEYVVAVEIDGPPLHGMAYGVVGVV